MTVKSRQNKRQHNIDTKAKKKVDHRLLDRLKIAWLMTMGTIALFLLLSLFSYSDTDPGWTVANANSGIHNYAGILGAYTTNSILTIFGLFGFLLPFLLVYGIWLVFSEKQSLAHSSILLMILRLLGAVLLLVSGSALANIWLDIFSIYMPQGAGGILGQQVSKQVVLYLSTAGGLLILVVAFALGLTLLSGGYWIRLTIKIIRFTILKTTALLRQLFTRNTHQVPNQRNNVVKQSKNPTNTTDYYSLDAEKHKKLADIHFITGNSVSHEASEPDDIMAQYQDRSDNAVVTPLPALSKSQEYQIKNNLAKKSNDIHQQKTDKKTGLPALTLLDDSKEKPETVSKAFLEKMSRLVEEKLADFGVQVQVVASFPGPVITRFELELAPGVKASKLSGLAQDLARSLSTARVRVVEVIPGKPYVGLELPNQTREIVRLKAVLADKKFKTSDSPVTMGLGVGISGSPEMVNLAKMPHLLVAGTTGSGKSVGVNAMIISMLYKATPADLRLIMIDPKMLELSIYEGIPHLLTPVVTDMNEAANALRWCVKEMDRRYELMAALGVRNITRLNEKILNANKSAQPIKDPLWLKLHPGQEHDAPTLEKLPFIVVIADEFADMMMVVGKKVEELIARIAQKARAAGIHLILATQRPSVDVVTGLIKANIPARIAFQVSSKIDSRTILDQQGAEQLLGHGDMLYLPPGSCVPKRIHGAFVDDDEVHRVVAAWKEMVQPDYIDQITASVPDEPENEDNIEAQDPLYDEAVNIVLETQRASISNIQRRLRIGYNRSARLIEIMEKAGLVSEMQSNGMREVLVKK